MYYSFMFVLYNVAYLKKKSLSFIRRSYIKKF